MSVLPLDLWQMDIRVAFIPIRAGSRLASGADRPRTRQGAGGTSPSAGPAGRPADLGPMTRSLYHPRAVRVQGRFLPGLAAPPGCRRLPQRCNNRFMASMSTASTLGATSEAFGPVS